MLRGRWPDLIGAGHEAPFPASPSSEIPQVGRKPAHWQQKPERSDTDHESYDTRVQGQTEAPPGPARSNP